MSSKPGTFKKGKDARRNSGGNLNAQAQAWSIAFRNHLAKELGPEEAAKIVAREYRRGRPWAIQEANERLAGKVTQPVSGDMTVKGQVAFIMPRPEKVDG